MSQMYGRRLLLRPDKGVNNSKVVEKVTIVRNHEYCAEKLVQHD